MLELWRSRGLELRPGEKERGRPRDPRQKNWRLARRCLFRSATTEKKRQIAFPLSRPRRTRWAAFAHCRNAHSAILRRLRPTKKHDLEERREISSATESVFRSTERKKKKKKNERRGLARSLRSLSLSRLSLPFSTSLKKNSALALIPDDDDLELISKARANRTQRLAREKGAEAAFTNAEGFKASPLAGAQAAVFTLQRAGAQLDAGDAQGAADTLNSGADFVQTFSASAAKVSASAAAKASAAEAAARLSALRQASVSGDAKAAFAGAARAVAAWAKDAGVAGSLQGL